MKVKIFTSNSAKDLEKTVNDWVEQLPCGSLGKIQYQVAGGHLDYRYSVLIEYD